MTKLTDDAGERWLSTKAAHIHMLKRVLAKGPRPVADILRIAASAGLEKPGVLRPSKPLRAAREELGVETRKAGLDSGWWWALPGEHDDRRLMKGRAA